MRVGVNVALRQLELALQVPLPTRTCEPPPPRPPPSRLDPPPPTPFFPSPYLFLSREFFLLLLLYFPTSSLGPKGASTRTTTTTTKRTKRTILHYGRGRAEGNKPSSPFDCPRLFGHSSIGCRICVVVLDQAPICVITRGNRRRGVNLGPRDPSLDYTDSVWNCAKELAGGS